MVSPLEFPDSQILLSDMLPLLYPKPECQNL
jgi:hypothetical protein